MNIKKYICYGLMACTLAVTTGCDDLFDEAPVDKISEKDVWKNPMLLDEYILTWYRGMSHGFSTFVPTTITLVKSASRYYMPWFGDQVVPSHNDYYNAGYGDLLKSNSKEITQWASVQWSSYYSQIQAINRLFQNQGDIPAGSQKERALGEAYFFRAYYYYMLWRQWGGVMLIYELFDPLTDHKTFPRASYPEMVEAIVRDARKAAELLPLKHDNTEEGRITKGAALMLIAKTYQWAAGAKFQNQEKEYLGFTDDQTTAMLEKAKVAYEEIINLRHYELVPITGTTEEEIKKGYRSIFLTKNSVESILEVQHSNDGNYSTGFGHKLDRDAAAPHFTGTTAAYTPTQNHVNEYGMREGLTLDPQNPYVGRDYRFYANILYDGAMWNGHEMAIHYTRVQNTETPAEDLTPYGSSGDKTTFCTRTGYYMSKFLSETQTIDNNDTYASSQNYIIWRYAEVLLDYAEVLFELGDAPAALEKVNEVRRRAHMHDLPSLTREQLDNERRVELAFEETTYWDFFRRGTAMEKLNGESNPLKMMKIVKRKGQPTNYNGNGNLNRFPKRVRVFTEKQYYLPIPWDEIRYHGIAQNPEWVEV